MEQSSLTQFEGQVLEDSRLTLLGDGAQTVDLLGYQPYAEALVEVLAQRDLQTPFAVGVFGRWGTGKSTFMNLVRGELSRDERRKKGLAGGFHTLWFQPWQFEEKEEVWKALILSVIRYLEVVEARESTRGAEEAERIKATLRELAKSVGKLALNKTIQTLTSGVVDLDTVLDAYAKTARDNSQFINTFREQFGELKTEILKQAEDDLPRLFVFVDDLDRCAPDNCIMVLEAIKLFFDLPECVFVLGIDREVVQRGIEEKYRNSLGIHGQDYIDKLIQLPFSLPPLRKQTFERFVSSITADFKFPPEVQKLIVQAADGNPRLAKRLSNCLQLTRTVALRLFRDNNLSDFRDTVGELDEAKLALLLTLQVRYPVAYLWLARKPVVFDELSANWQVKGDAGTGVQETGYRAQLVQLLKSAYGDRIAEQTADGFFSLWKYAHSEAVQVSRFADENELQAYMRITGLVDEDRARGAAKSQPPTGRETVDRSYLAPEDWDKAPDDDGVQALGYDTTEALLEEEAGRATALSARSADIVLKWENFSASGVLRAAWALPGLLRKASQLPGEAARTLESLQRFFKTTRKPYDELRDYVAELADINPQRSYRHVSEVALVFSLCWPIAMALLGTAVRLLWGAISAQLDPSSLLFQFGTQVFLPPETAARDLANPIQMIPQLPAIFPGGPLFFWAAVIYLLVGIAIWLRARLHLQQLARQSG